MPPLRRWCAKSPGVAAPLLLLLSQVVVLIRLEQPRAGSAVDWQQRRRGTEGQRRGKDGAAGCGGGQDGASGWPMGCIWSDVRDPVVCCIHQCAPACCTSCLGVDSKWEAEVTCCLVLRPASMQRYDDQIDGPQPEQSRTWHAGKARRHQTHHGHLPVRHGPRALHASARPCVQHAPLPTPRSERECRVMQANK